MLRTAVPVYFITFCFDPFINMHLLHNGRASSLWNFALEIKQRFPLGGPSSPGVTIENYASYMKSFSLVVSTSAADCLEKLFFKTCYVSTDMLQISC